MGKTRSLLSASTKHKICGGREWEEGINNGGIDGTTKGDVGISMAEWVKASGFEI